VDGNDTSDRPDAVPVAQLEEHLGNTASNVGELKAILAFG